MQWLPKRECNFTAFLSDIPPILYKLAPNLDISMNGKARQRFAKGGECHALGMCASGTWQHLTRYMCHYGSLPLVKFNDSELTAS